MKTRILLLVIGLGFVMNGFGQGIISGRIEDPNKQPVPFATVKVYQKDSLVTGTVSNEQGRFEVTNLKNGDYQLGVTFVGMKSVDKRFVVGNLNKTLDFGNIILLPTSKEINEVVVSANREALSAELDKKSYTASELLTQANGSVLDAMKQLPGITVDKDSKVQLRGSDKVIVLIDGKQSALTGFGSQKGLENIPASQVETIEIINNPSAKYDAAGMAGIVNLTFKKQQKTGLNGDAGLSFGLGQLSKSKADLPTGMPSYSLNPKYTPSLNLNYKTKTFNVFLQSYWVNQKKLPNNEFSTRHYPTNDYVESQVAENRLQNHYNVKLGVDWYISDKQTLTVFGLYDYEWHIDTTKVWYFQNGNYAAPIRKYGFYESEGTGFTNVTVQYKLKFVQPGHELNSQYLYTKGWEDETYHLRQDATSGFPAINGDMTHILAPEYVHQFSTDYVRPLPFGRLETGAMARFRNMPITYTMTRASGNTALIFDYGDWSNWSENLAAGYVNFVSELPRWDIEAGLRGEFTGVNYRFAPNTYFSDNRYSYFKLFPNVRITLKANQKNKVSAFFNRRIDRPGEDILRIFPKYDDPELLKIGNPKLQPQVTSALEVAYRSLWQGGSFSASVYYKNITDYYTRIYIQDPLHTNITVKGYSNIPKATNTGLELNVDNLFAKKWKLNVNGNIYLNTLYGHTGEINFPTPVPFTLQTQRDLPWFVKMNNTVTVSPRVKCELSGAYYSKKAIAQGTEYYRWGVDAAVRTFWLDNKLELNLTGNDLLNTMGVRQHIDQGNGYTTDYQNFYETQVISLGAKYTF